jgi:hypothetical protein
VKIGRVIPGDGSPVQVEYELWVADRDNAGGRIQIGSDPVPGHRFMGDPASVFPGDLNCVLETASSVRVSIFLKNADGTFRCANADEAREALKAGG